MVKISVSRTINAPKSRVWEILADVERWPDWAPLTATNRVITHPIVSRDGNVVVCDETEEAGLIRTHHRDRYTLHPDEGSLEETIIEGDLQGGINVTLTPTPDGAGVVAHVDADISPKNAALRVFSDIAGGKEVLTKFWIDLFDQLASMAESPCSPAAPMYCPSRMVGAYFDNSTTASGGDGPLPLASLVNQGGRQIDIQNKMIYDDGQWKGIYPPDSLMPAWVFQDGFTKKFWKDSGDGDDQLTGVTSTFDDTIKGHNKLSAIDPSDPSKGVLLKYTDPQYALFYDILKQTGKDTVVGKAFTGRYPDGKVLLSFTMSRRYSFDFMSAEDHRELWEKYGRVPDTTKIAGEWQGRMVSNASLTSGLFRFWYTVDLATGAVGCKWNFMHILKGTSKIEMTSKQLEMFDFTNFHDEIRMIADNAMVGRYLPKSSEILDVIGKRDLGLVHFEKTAEGTRPVIYYYIKKVLPANT